MNIPQNLKYSEDHEWLRIEGNEAYIGISDYAQHELGDIVFVDVDTEGEELSAGDTFGSIEAVKTVSDLLMPVSGKVLEVKVNVGDIVSKGQTVAIVEAMKLENEIQSAFDGKVKQILVEKGSDIRNKDVMIVLE